MTSARDTLIDAKMDLNDTRLRLRLESMPKQLQKRLQQTIGRLTRELLHKVEAREPVRTGRLRSLTEAYVDTNDIKMFVRGRVRVLRSREHNTAAAAYFLLVALQGCMTYTTAPLVATELRLPI